MNKKEYDTVMGLITELTESHNDQIEIFKAFHRLVSEFLYENGLADEFAKRLDTSQAMDILVQTTIKNKAKKILRELNEDNIN